MAASIKCDERPFKGGVWGGFASEVYPPPATRSSTSRCKIFQASKGKQPQAKASKSKPKEAKASKSQLEFKFKISSTLDCAWQKQAGSSVELILNFNSSWLLLALASFGLLLLAFACFGLLWLLWLLALSVPLLLRFYSSRGSVDDGKRRMAVLERCFWGDLAALAACAFRSIATQVLRRTQIVFIARIIL